MFARVVELRAKFRKASELAQTINRKIIPILQRQAGFVDEIVLVSDTESDEILALSFWKSRQDAERYNREQYLKVNEIISHVVERAPVIKTFNVDTSTSHKITAKKAAWAKGASLAARLPSGKLDHDAVGFKLIQG
jgi:quinol monooxygenase YgiN